MTERLRVSVYGVPPGKERVSRHWWRRLLYAYCPPYRWWRNSALYHKWMCWRMRRTARRLVETMGAISSNMDATAAAQLHMYADIARRFRGQTEVRP